MVMPITGTETSTGLKSLKPVILFGYHGKVFLDFPCYPRYPPAPRLQVVRKRPIFPSDASVKVLGFSRLCQSESMNFMEAEKWSPLYDGKSQFFMGKSTISTGTCSIAM
jgi:hypothetical protein